MRVTSTQYAKSLYEATVDKSHSEVDVLVSNFVKVLAKNGQMRLKNEILQKFEKVANLKNGIVVAEVKSCEKLNSELVDKLNSFIKVKYQAEKVVIENIIDERIGGGVIVKVGDEIFNGSITNQLRTLRRHLTK
ncbi:MAG: ATP synthase F1 subunit delta [Candidatus Moranbacteria bacterium]|nr:ATP synthase F1 subunit delta [Candidatus Moranbacteria bacterium]